MCYVGSRVLRWCHSYIEGYFVIICMLTGVVGELGTIDALPTPFGY